MFAPLLYKEYREQRSTWLALALAGAGVLLGMPLLYRPVPSELPAFQAIMGIAAGVLAWSFGLVCGAMLLAGERETGTQDFLDTLPAGRLWLWLNKCVIGGAFVYLQLALLAGQVLLCRYFPPGDALAGVLPLLDAGMVGFAWGLLFSALSGNTLHAIGLALLGQLLLLPLLFFEVILTVGLRALLLDFSIVWEVTPLRTKGVFIFVVSLLGSALVYGGVDWQRRGVVHVGLTSRIAVVVGLVGARWLAWRQSRGLAIGMAVFSVLAGLFLVGQHVFVWPVLTLIIGAICGTTAFTDEQSGAHRFLGDQRFPLGRFWFVKAGARLLVLCLAIVLMLATAGIEELIVYLREPTKEPQPFWTGIFGSRLVGPAIPVGPFVVLWPAFGFAAGIMCGLLFRQVLVALFAALGLGSMFVVLWVPALLLKGMHVWQALGVPLVLLAGSWVLMRPWAANHLRSLATVRCLAWTSIAAVAFVVFAHAWRVWEIRDTPEPEGFRTFVASLPTPEENEAGRLIQRACERVQVQRNRPVDFQGDRNIPLFPSGVSAPDQFIEEFDVLLLSSVVDRGGEWLEDISTDDWYTDLRTAVTKPLGVVEDPRRLSAFTPLRTLQAARSAAFLVALHGLRLQRAKHKPAAFVEQLTISLSLVRNLHNRAPSTAALFAQFIEAEQLEALTRWLEFLDEPRATQGVLLARAANLLQRHQRALPADYRDQRLADYLVARNSLDQPEIAFRHFYPGKPASEVPEAALAAAYESLPWERARQERLLRSYYRRNHGPEQAAVLRGLLWVPPPATSPLSILEHGHPRRLVRLRAAGLIIALRHFQAETGQAAERLEQLVPKHLRQIPEDPFSGRPFRYRLSQGEDILWQQPGFAENRRVPSGQGILWSAGEDKRDDDGRRQGLRRTSDAAAMPGEDLIYLVPLPKAKP